VGKWEEARGAVGKEEYQVEEGWVEEEKV